MTIKILKYITRKDFFWKAKGLLIEFEFCDQASEE